MFQMKKTLILLTAFLLMSCRVFGVSYEGSFVYILDGSGGRMLESIAFDEGRILGNGTGYVADYHIKDHLGSVRSVVRNGSVIEEDDYYPYGMRQTKAGQLRQTSPVANRYLFSSKEDQSVLFGQCGLDFGAREYDAAGLTWYEPDPLASKYYGLSPYSYCAGNPVMYVDPDCRVIYMLFYTTGNGRGDEMFKSAAQTRKHVSQ